MLTLDANLFREFIGTTWTLEGRREAGTVTAYATRITAQTFTLRGNKVTKDGRPVRKGEVPKYVLTRLRKLVKETENNAGFFDCTIVYFDYNVTADEIGDHAKIVRAIRSVYVFDANRHVHACELTPSYELHHLYDTMVFMDGIDYPGDDVIEELAEKYERNFDADVEYHHVSSIDRLPSNRLNRIGGYAVKYVSDDDDGSDETDYEEVLEYVREHYSCNHTF